MGYRAVAVFGDLRQQAVRVDHDAGCFGFLYDAFLECRVHPDNTAGANDFVEVEKNVSFVVVADSVLDKDIPLREVVFPVSEFHVETAIHGIVSHLPVEAFPVCHRAFPFRTAGCYCHQCGTLLSVCVVTFGAAVYTKRACPSGG